MHVCCIYDTYPDDITLQFSHIAMVFDLPRAPEAQRLSVRCTWPGIKTTIGPWRRVRRYSVPVCLVLLLWWFVFRFSEMRRLWYRNEPLVNVYIANWNRTLFIGKLAINGSIFYSFCRFTRGQRKTAGEISMAMSGSNKHNWKTSPWD